MSEKIDFVPASYTVVETVVPRYFCPQCHDGVKSAAAPAQAVEKGLAAKGFIAQVIASKYVMPGEASCWRWKAASRAPPPS